MRLGSYLNDSPELQKTMDPLHVNADAAYRTSHDVGNCAEELRDELVALQRDWDNLSHGWSGGAATAYASAWTEWLDGATRLIDSLADTSDKLGAAAVLYGEQDAQSAAAVDSTPIDLEL